MKNRVFVFILLSVLFYGCINEKVDSSPYTLSDYLCENMELTRGINVIACAGGKEGGLFENDDSNTSLFFYPIENASNVQYFESNSSVINPTQEDYVINTPSSTPVFNGYLRKFNVASFTGEKWAVVTFETPGKIHVSDPIKIKTNTKPTEVNSALLTITEDNVQPTFNWDNGVIDENVIFFHVISELTGDLISGTYTTDQNFTFYDLTNVVLNVSPGSPELDTNSNYKFTLMGVSEDNWVNMISQQDFSTN